MTNRAYHIHVCLVRNEQPALENALQDALTPLYNLTWDLIANPENANAFSRRQIDASDAVLFVLGEDYGALSPTGISYLHLNYLYARNKPSPVVALLRSAATLNTVSRQRLDLANQVQKEQYERTVLYHDVAQAVDGCLRLVTALVEHHMSTKANIATFAADATLTPTTATPAPAAPPLSCTPFSKRDRPNAAPNPEPLSQSAPTLHLVLDDTVLVNYSAHAYQHGNLHDITATHLLSWGEILDMIALLPVPFSTDMLQRAFNDLLKAPALAVVEETMPDAHAVSRCQINSLDLQWIKQQLIHGGWIIPYKDERSTRELWQLNRNMTLLHDY